jgi:hypothetical protein
MFAEVPAPTSSATCRNALRMLDPKDRPPDEPPRRPRVRRGLPQPAPPATRPHRTRASRLGPRRGHRVRLAPDAGGRILELPLREGDRVEVGAPRRPTRRAGRHARARARPRRTRARRGAAAPRAGRRARRISPGQRPDRHAHAPMSPPRRRSSRGRRGPRSASSRSWPTAPASRKQRDDAATRRDVARERVGRPRVGCAPPSRPARRLRRRPPRRGRRRACARGRAAAQIATLEKNVADTTSPPQSAASSPRSSSSQGEVIAPRAPVARGGDLDRAWADCSCPSPPCRAFARPDGARSSPTPAARRHRGHGRVDLAEGRVHAAQRADGRRAFEARLPHPRRGGQPRRRAQAGHARRSRACR